MVVGGGLRHPGPDDLLGPAVATAEMAQQLPHVPPGQEGTAVVRSAPLMQGLNRLVCATISAQ
jgi:hypothetical protein